MKEVYVVKSESEGIRNICVMIISIISLGLIIWTGIYGANRDGCIALTIIQNISISVLAAGVYYAFAEFIHKEVVKRKVEPILGEYYRAIARDIDGIFYSITAQSEWKSQSFANLKELCDVDNVDAWFSEDFGYLKLDNGENYWFKTRIDLIKQCVEDFDKKITHVENVLEWSNAKELKHIFMFYNSRLYMCIQKTRMISEDEWCLPDTYAYSLLREIPMRTLVDDNKEMVEEIARFVNKYK